MSSADLSRISDLSRVTGVPLATIKFYLREGLVPAGERTAPNRASYGEKHVARLRLIRTLRETGGLGLEAIHGIIQVLDDPELPIIDVLEAATCALLPRRDAERLPEEAEINKLFELLGWTISPESATRARLAETLLALRDSFIPQLSVEAFIPYARAVEPIARDEIAYFQAAFARDRDGAVEAAVVGTILFENALIALRRAAHEHFTLTTWPPANAAP